MSTATTTKGTPMIDTSYTMISTIKLIDRFISYGLVGVIVYGENGPDEIMEIEAMKNMPVTVVTKNDRYEIPAADKNIKMWRVLA